MPKFVTIGYGDEAGYRRTSEEARAAAHANDEALEKRGAMMGVAGAPVQVRNPENRGIETSPGAYMQCALPIAGFALIEAADLQEAVLLVSRSPCAIAHGVIEIWPLEEG